MPSDLTPVLATVSMEGFRWSQSRGFGGISGGGGGWLAAMVGRSILSLTVQNRW